MKSPVKRSKPEASRPDFSREAPDLGIVCGVDEAGRGPLAGPVYAGCVYIPPEQRAHPVWSAVRDSKKLTAGRREDLFSIIKSQSCYGIAFATAQEIDSMNILQATYLAMSRAIAAMCQTHHLTPALVLIDGNRAPKIPYPTQTVVKGDALSVSIAAASILAKVSRDHVMQDLHAEFPVYNWASNAGYGTPDHLHALQESGPSPHHRMTFAPLKAA